MDRKKRSSYRRTQSMDDAQCRSLSKKLKGVMGSTSTTMPYFPLDIIVNILSRLPVKPLIRFQIVCKLWYCLIFHPFFVDMHLRRAKQRPGYLMKANNRMVKTSYPPKLRPVHFLQEKEEAVQEMVEVFQPSESRCCYYSIVDSSNGLVCFSNYYDTVCIYNPSTREYINLPKTSVRTLEMGFAYDPTSKKYKVFRIFPIDPQPGSNNISAYEVFTLGSNSWRRKEPLPYYPSETKHIQCGGAVHWLFGGKDKLFPNWLLSINISIEKHRVRPIPHSVDRTYKPFLIELHGILALCMMGAETMQIWVLTRIVFWVPVYNCTMPNWITRAPVPMRVSPTLARNYEILLTRGRNKLVFYNLRTLMSRNVDTSSIGNWTDLHVTEHLETLVPCRSRSMKWPEAMKILESYYADYKDDEVPGINLDPPL